MATEIQNSLARGVLKNNRNGAYVMMQRSVTWANNATQKALKTRNINDALDTVQDQIKTLACTQKENMQKIKALKTAKSELRLGKGKKGNLKTSASTSGKHLTDYFAPWMLIVPNEPN
jgi:hypothetical protein